MPGVEFEGRRPVQGGDPEPFRDRPTSLIRQWQWRSALIDRLEGNPKLLHGVLQAAIAEPRSVLFARSQFSKSDDTLTELHLVAAVCCLNRSVATG